MKVILHLGSKMTDFIQMYRASRLFSMKCVLTVFLQTFPGHVEKQRQLTTVGFPREKRSPLP